VAEDDIEYAEANHVQVLETNVLHAADVIYWLNGSSAENAADMQRLDLPLQLRVSEKPRDAKILNGAGKTAILRKPSIDMVIGEASEADKTRPALPAFSLVGEAWDNNRRFNPARFNLNLGAGNGEQVVLYPSPLGTRVPPGGSVFGALHLDGGNNPLIWALLELTVSISSEEDQVYRAQCDAKGDFTIALNRLPPLPESISSYNAVLRASGSTTTNASVAPDTSSYAALQLQAASNSSFNTEYALTVIPGQRLRLNSSGKDYLAASTT